MADRRSGTIGFLLSFVSLGLGFLYAGRWRLAITAAAFPIGTVAIIAWTRLIFIPVVFPATILFVITGYIVIWIASFIVARRAAIQPISSGQRWYWYVFFIVASYGLNFATLGHRGQFFGYESFRIPSGAMMPTVLPGDFIIANSWTYRRIAPTRGDIAVFRFPPDPSKKYIKRVVGVPGDRIAYRNKTLYINETAVETSERLPYLGLALPPNCRNIPAAGAPGICHSPNLDRA